MDNKCLKCRYDFMSYHCLDCKYNNDGEVKPFCSYCNSSNCGNCVWGGD